MPTVYLVYLSAIGSGAPTKRGRNGHTAHTRALLHSIVPAGRPTTDGCAPALLPYPCPTTGLAMIAAAGMIVQETFVTHAKLF